MYVDCVSWLTNLHIRGKPFYAIGFREFVFYENEMSCLTDEHLTTSLALK